MHMVVFAELALAQAIGIKSIESVTNLDGSGIALNMSLPAGARRSGRIASGNEVMRASALNPDLCCGPPLGSVK
ncbi:hypothetical protein ACVWWO_003286 [Bradyrhizobium sp. F1.13.1]